MTILTLAAIAENEWNAVAYDLPTDPDRDLLEATYSAAQHCAAKEFHLMNAALVGPGRVGDEGYYEERWLEAGQRVVLASDRYWRSFQARIDDPDDDAEAAVAVSRRLR